MKIKGFIIFVLTLSLLALCGCSPNSQVQGKELTLEDFFLEDGSFGFPYCPEGTDAAGFEAAMGLSYDQLVRQLNKVEDAIEKGKDVPDCAPVFSMYGFRCFGTPTGLDSSQAATGYSITFIDDGQGEDAWQAMSRDLMADVDRLLKYAGFGYYTSPDGETTLYFNQTGISSTYSDSQATVAEIGTETYVDYFWLQYE